MSDLFIGWDVGAWNCDRNRKSRDTLCALVARDQVPEVVGSPWRGNLRSVFAACDGLDLVHELLKLVEAPTRPPLGITIAIDTPLAWPKRMINLVTNGAMADVPAEADRNPYLFRIQELALFTQGCRPLSVVRDMIGARALAEKEARPPQSGPRGRTLRSLRPTR